MPGAAALAPAFVQQHQTIEHVQAVNQGMTVFNLVVTAAAAASLFMQK